MKIRFAVAASGGGSDFQSIVDAQKAGKIPYGEVVILFSDKESAGALQRARNADIPAIYIDHTVSSEQRDKAIINAFIQHGAQFLFLAGYLKKISPALIAHLPIYNIHPALDLHKFGGKGMYGLNVHRAAIQAGAEYTGATIHEVNENFDEGKILMQTTPVKIDSNDTPESLQLKVLAAEHELIPQFIDKLTRQMVASK
jgi:phosphoribosylglycinamide formyltransferase-1